MRALLGIAALGAFACTHCGTDRSEPGSSPDDLVRARELPTGTYVFDGEIDAMHGQFNLLELNPDRTFHRTAIGQTCGIFGDCEIEDRRGTYAAEFTSATEGTLRFTGEGLTDVYRFRVSPGQLLLTNDATSREQLFVRAPTPVNTFREAKESAVPLAVKFVRRSLCRLQNVPGAAPSRRLLS